MFEKGFEKIKFWKILDYFKKMKKSKRTSNVWKILELRNYHCTLQIIIVYIFYDILICNIYVFTLIPNNNTIRGYATKRYPVIFQIFCWCPILFHVSFRNRQFYAKRPNKNSFFQILYTEKRMEIRNLFYFLTYKILLQL